jgi:hypothetical protein
LGRYLIYIAIFPFSNFLVKRINIISEFINILTYINKELKNFKNKLEKTSEKGKILKEENPFFNENMLKYLNIFENIFNYSESNNTYIFKDKRKFSRLLKQFNEEYSYYKDIITNENNENNENINYDKEESIKTLKTSINNIEQFYNSLFKPLLYFFNFSYENILLSYRNQIKLTYKDCCQELTHKNIHM